MLVATVAVLWPRDPRHAFLGAQVPDLPGTVNQWWMTWAGGLELLQHTRWAMFPATIDRLAEMGFPLDAMMAVPFLSAFGWPTGFNLAVAAFFLGCGLSAGVLGWRWWRS